MAASLEVEPVLRRRTMSTRGNPVSKSDRMGLGLSEHHAHHQHRRAKSESDSGAAAAHAMAEVERLRRASGLADVLPAEPPQSAVRSIPMIEMPAHALRDSMLHSGSGFNNYRGLYNLALIALFVSTFRMALENISKYGLLVHPTHIIRAMTEPGASPCIYILLALGFSALAALTLEKLAARGHLSNRVANSLQYINTTLSLVGPMITIVLTHPPPVLSAMVMIQSAIVWMKLVSYVDVNKHYRATRGEPIEDESESDSSPSVGSPSEKRMSPRKEHRSASSESPTSSDMDAGLVYDPLVFYPQNLTVNNMAYFFVAPTLCYELNFPRNPRIRKRFLLRRAFECVFLLAVVMGIGQQWILPTVENTFKRGSEVPLNSLIDRTLKLSVPNNLMWMTLFYLFFHSYLNLVGEVLRFGDRQFYRDWWNSTTITYFWKNWNIPVHKWAVRHVYRPLLISGRSKMTAQLSVFMVSAVLHELLVSVPLGMFRVWAFMAMMVQVPLALITDQYLKNTQYGNVVMWASLFFGQPAAVMLYVQAYLAQQD